MFTIQDLVDSIIDEKQDIISVLRKAKVIATFIESKELINWINQEMSGYRDERTRELGLEHSLASIPLYRRLKPVYVQGVVPQYGFKQSISSQISIESSDETNLEEQVLFTHSFFDSIVQLQEHYVFLEKTNEPNGTVKWGDSELYCYAALVRKKKIKDEVFPQNFTYIEKLIPQALIKEVIENVRNTLLDFALDLRDISPEIGSSKDFTVSNPAVRRTEQTIIVNIYGEKNNVNVGETINQKVDIQQGDIEALLTILKRSGLEANTISEVQELTNQPIENQKKGINKLFDKIKDESVSFALNEGKQMASLAIKQFFGMES